jgi:hypothetical protein
MEGKTFVSSLRFLSAAEDASSALRFPADDASYCIWPEKAFGFPSDS